MDIYAIFWDIDGTLLTTKRAGVFALLEACRVVLRQDVDLEALDMRGLPDTEIAARILIHCGLSPDEGAIRRFLAVYEEHLPRCLGLRQGGALPGVRAVLARLREREDVLLALLTGNTRAGARAKLRHYGLDEFFTFGAFAENTRDRDAIARRALALAREAAGRDIPPRCRFVVGDTPHDVQSGATIEARTIALSTGGYSKEELERHGAWIAWPQLPDPEKFERALGLSPAVLRPGRD